MRIGIRCRVHLQTLRFLIHRHDKRLNGIQLIDVLRLLRHDEPFTKMFRQRDAHVVARRQEQAIKRLFDTDTLPLLESGG